MVNIDFDRTKETTASVPEHHFDSYVRNLEVSRDVVNYVSPLAEMLSDYFIKRATERSALRGWIYLFNKFAYRDWLNQEFLGFIDYAANILNVLIRADNQRSHVDQLLEKAVAMAAEIAYASEVSDHRELGEDVHRDDWPEIERMLTLARRLGDDITRLGNRSERNYNDAPRRQDRVSTGYTPPRDSDRGSRYERETRRSTEPEEFGHRSRGSARSAPESNQPRRRSSAPASAAPTPKEEPVMYPEVHSILRQYPPFSTNVRLIEIGQGLASLNQIGKAELEVASVEMKNNDASGLLQVVQRMLNWTNFIVAYNPGHLILSAKHLMKLRQPDGKPGVFRCFGVTMDPVLGNANHTARLLLLNKTDLSETAASLRFQLNQAGDPAFRGGGPADVDQLLFLSRVDRFIVGVINRFLMGDLDLPRKASKWTDIFAVGVFLDQYDAIKNALSKVDSEKRYLQAFEEFEQQVAPILFWQDAPQQHSVYQTAVLNQVRRVDGNPTEPTEQVSFIPHKLSLTLVDITAGELKLHEKTLVTRVQPELFGLAASLQNQKSVIFNPDSDRSILSHGAAPITDLLVTQDSQVFSIHPAVLSEGVFVYRRLAL